ncbi:hypothetical protein NBRC116599_14070 [Aquicoccus sp. SU-CL01552]
MSKRKQHAPEFNAKVRGRLEDEGGHPEMPSRGLHARYARQGAFKHMYGAARHQDAFERRLRHIGQRSQCTRKDLSTLCAQNPRAIPSLRVSLAPVSNPVSGQIWIAWLPPMGLV